MIYPKKISSKKLDVFLNITTISLIVISVILLIINLLTSPNIYWSHLCIIGFIYAFFTIKYSIVNTTNISNHVVIQTILLSALICFVDYRIGYRGWSINIAIPILLIISNITMFIITLASYKHYGKYAISQLIIVLISMSTIYFIYKGYAKNSAINNISIIISIINAIKILKKK